MGGQSGTHIINIDLETLPSTITTCVFVVSAFGNATLQDITSASVAFRNELADPSEDPLCVYQLDSHDKISHLKSVIIMCKLYRKRGGGWHIMAIGDSNRGSASNYAPIYDAVRKLL
jgi:stress response protein SCP2